MAVLADLNAAFETWKSQGLFDRPFVTLSYAQSLDGSVAVEKGKPTVISSKESLAITHQLRSWHDGILIGIGTLLSDNPRLTARMGAIKQPQPIVLDSNLRFPRDAHLLSHEKSPWIFSLREGQDLIAESFTQLGCRLFHIPPTEKSIDLMQVLKTLKKEGLKSVMVEGGGEVISAFLRSQLVDHAVITISSTFIGGYNVLSSSIMGVDQNQQDNHFPRIAPTALETIGNDIILSGPVVYSN
jgi:riboflavin-specific deaminase-like protein